MFTDNKELILSLSFFPEATSNIFSGNGQWANPVWAGSGRTNCLGQTAPRRTVTLRNSTVRSDYRLRRQQFSNDLTPMNHILTCNFKLGYV